MENGWTLWKPTPRDKLIGRVQRGKITPTKAEEEAEQRGFGPLAEQPPFPAFDPLLESRWTIVQVIAWIAWRDIGKVRENSAEFCEHSTRWVSYEARVPASDGKSSELRRGWDLKSWPRPTRFRLGFCSPPSTAVMTIADAEKSLWRALAESRFTAEAMDVSGRPVDVPAREWSYLKLFEDRDRDVLRYERSDRTEPFTQVKLKRDDVLRLWPDPAAHSPEASADPAQAKHAAVQGGLRLIADGKEVHLNGQVFRFVKGVQQRRIIRLLFERYLKGQYRVSSEEILEEAECRPGTRPRDVFNKHPAWGKLLNEQAGMCGFCLNPSSEEKGP